VQQHNDIMPLSPPLSWDAMKTDDLKADASDAAPAERGADPIIPFWDELPSRRWLIEASRFADPDC